MICRKSESKSQQNKIKFYSTYVYRLAIYLHCWRVRSANSPFVVKIVKIYEIDWAFVVSEWFAWSFACCDHWFVNVVADDNFPTVMDKNTQFPKAIIQYSSTTPKFSYHDFWQKSGVV